MSISANLSGEPAAAQREVYERMLELAELTVYRLYATNRGERARIVVEG
jgi:hypothetical protein